MHTLNEEEGPPLSPEALRALWADIKAIEQPVATLAELRHLLRQCMKANMRIAWQARDDINDVIVNLIAIVDAVRGDGQ